MDEDLETKEVKSTQTTEKKDQEVETGKKD